MAARSFFYALSPLCGVRTKGDGDFLRCTQKVTVP